jgi:hypothetical protein
MYVYLMYVWSISEKWYDATQRERDICAFTTHTHTDIYVYTAHTHTDICVHTTHKHTDIYVYLMYAWSISGKW